MDADNWSTLPDDLLVDIFHRLDFTAVIRCAGACRSWRRAIIANASCLRLRPGRFLPDILLGYIEKHLRLRHSLPWELQYVPASNTTLPFVMPATGVCADGKQYSDLITLRDGLLLLREDMDTGDSLCLCTHTGICKVLPAAEFDNSSVRYTVTTYVLATGYDVVHDSDDMAVWILAVRWQPDCKDGVIYQIFSSTSGKWGPVKCSAKFPEDVTCVLSYKTTPYGWVVVSHGAVSWLVHQEWDRRRGTCVISIDLLTERTWTTEVPPGFGSVDNSLVLAVSEDGRLSLVRLLARTRQMEVWVLAGDGQGDGGQWMQRLIIDDVKKLLPNCPIISSMRLSGFCPRSGYLFGAARGYPGILQHYFVIRIDGTSPRLIGSAEYSYSNSPTMFPYEMDSSTHISRCISMMKYF